MISRRFRAMTDHTPQKTKDWLAAAGTAEGFDICAVTAADLPPSVAAGLDDYIGAGHHGDMGWLADTRDRRITPSAMWPEARSAVIFGCNYGPDHDPMENLSAASSANISVYARGRDYHDVLKGRLKQLAGRLASRTGWQVKVFVDTAPLMEKPLAARAGLGWQGKHTNLVSRDYGSWLFLGTILTDGLLPLMRLRLMPAGLVHPVLISARQTPFLPLTSWMRGAVSLISPLNLMAISRVNSDAPWATACLAVMTVWRSARGTNLPVLLRI